MCDLDGGDGLAPRFDTFEQIHFVIVTLVEMSFVRCNGRGHQRLRLGINLSAHDVHPTLSALEEDALLVLLVVGADNLDAVGVGVGDAEIAVHVPESVLRIFRLPFDLHGSGIFGSHAPLGDIVMVRPPAGNHAGSVVGDPQPAGPAVIFLRMDALFRIRRPGGRAEPHIVIKSVGDRHGRLHAR